MAFIFQMILTSIIKESQKKACIKTLGESAFIRLRRTFTSRN